METTEINLPALGTEGEPCTACGSPLASDQRYCLSCGTRRGAPRVDLDRQLSDARSATASQAESAALPAVAPTDQRVWTPFAIVGSITALGVMMLLGVMIGKDNPDGVQTASAPAPVVLESTGAETKTADAGETASGGGADKKGGEDKGGGNGGEEVAGDPAVTNQIDALEGLEGPAYAKEAAKLPDTVAIPGKPPKPDGKEPGGGSDAVTIGG